MGLRIYGPLLDDLILDTAFILTNAEKEVSPRWIAMYLASGIVGADASVEELAQCEVEIYSRAIEMFGAP